MRCAGYYEVDTDTVKETMRVVLPPIKDPRSAGLYIERECAGFPIYKLEKIVSGGKLVQLCKCRL